MSLISLSSSCFVEDVIIKRAYVQMKGVEDNLYLKSALSDLIRTLKRCVKAQRQTQTTPTKKEVKMAVKKLEFYLSWVDQHYHLLTTSK